MSATTQLDHAQTISEQKTFPLCILANDIAIAGNVGSLFRLADALGVEKLYLTGTTKTPPRYKIRKAARATENHVPFSYAKSAMTVTTQLKTEGYTIIALEITEKSIDIQKFSLHKQQPCCLIIGSENTGISPELLAQSEHHIHIPMYGKNSSMNVVTSCAIAVHELIKHY